MIYKVTAPNKTIKGTINLTASKSESNRALIIQALCKERFEIKNLATAADTKTLQNLLNSNENVLDVGPAGTTYRFLTAFLSTQEGREVVLTGSQRMKERPIKILVDALRDLGADIEYVDIEGFPPLKIKGKKLTGGELTIDGSISSQYISALLMIAPTLKGGLQIKFKGEVTSIPYITMTLNIMNHFKGKFDIKSDAKNPYFLKIQEQDYQPNEFTVEADWSSAAFWYEIVSLSESATIQLKGLKNPLSSFQGDAEVAKIYEKIGVATQVDSDGISLSFQKNKLIDDKVVQDFKECPDLVQAVACSFVPLKVPFSFNGLKTLRIKETDRVSALQVEWKKSNAKFEDETTSSDLLMHLYQQDIPEKLVNSMQVATYHDHRMAMAFAPLALVMDNVIIEDPEVVVKSYPEYWDHLKSVGFVIEEV